MEDADRLTPSLVARAALLCGAVVACLFLLSGTARADDGEAGEARGGLLGGTTDAVGSTVTDAVGGTVRGAVEQTHEAAAVVERTVTSAPRAVQQVVRPPAAQVGRAADGAAGAVDRVVGDLGGPDDLVGGLLRPGGGGSPADPEPAPPAEPVDEPTADPPADPAAPDDAADPAGAAPAQRPADDAARGVHRHADSGRHHPARERHAASAHPGDRAGAVTALPAPLEVAPRLSTSPASSAPAAARSGGAGGADSAGLLLLGPACDDCAAAGGSSGDTPHLLGLPSAGVSTPRTAAEVPRASAVGGPISVADRPDVSPG